jgi:hypothetical protein
MAELALEAIGGIRTVSALPQEKLSYSANNFVKLWLMYQDALNNGTIQPPIPKLPEVREVFRSEPIDRSAKVDMAWWHKTIEEKMPKHILDAIKKLRAEQSELTENALTQVEGFSALKDSFSR